MSAREFGGEPLVGEVVGLRTFRVDDYGLLLPLYADGCWYDGTNTAVCSPPTHDRCRKPHEVPGETCECGFYAYGFVEAAERNASTRYVQAVVSCWGGMVAGTRGFRAQYARIDAIWLHPRAPASVRQRVAVRYPSARMYADRDAMLAEHPLSVLECYETPPPRRRSSAALGVLAGALVLAFGLLPASTLHGSPALWAGWCAVTAASALTTAWLLVGSRSVGHVAAAFLMFSVVAWLLAPLFGITGWVLRVPLLRGFALLAGGLLLRLRRHYFPLEHTPSSGAFRGLRA